MAEPSRFTLLNPLKHEVWLSACPPDLQAQQLSLEDTRLPLPASVLAKEGVSRYILLDVKECGIVFGMSSEKWV